HLARFGDHEAASKLADPADGALKARIDTLQYEKNYPVEWTQLVGLVLHWSELSLASGKSEGATGLVVLHRQLREVLDEKAAAGPLGSALLSFGRKALADAAGAWGGPQGKQPALAEDIEAALKDWGTVPVAEPPLLPGAPKAEVLRFLQVTSQGKTVA